MGQPYHDGGSAYNTSLGVSGAGFTSADQSGAVAAVTDAPATNQSLVITDLIISAGADMVVTVSEETSGTVFLRLDFAAGTVFQFTPRGKFKLPTAGKRLMVRASDAGTLSVTAFYYSE